MSKLYQLKEENQILRHNRNKLIDKYTNLMNHYKEKSDNFNEAVDDMGDYAEINLAYKIYKEILTDLKALNNGKRHYHKVA